MEPDIVYYVTRKGIVEDVAVKDPNALFHTPYELRGRDIFSLEVVPEWTIGVLESTFHDYEEKIVTYYLCLGGVQWVRRVATMAAIDDVAAVILISSTELEHSPYVRPEERGTSHPRNRSQAETQLSVDQIGLHRKPYPIL